MTPDFVKVRMERTSALTFFFFDGIFEQIKWKIWGDVRGNNDAVRDEFEGRTVAVHDERSNNF
jgi:hypothetical protein